MHANSEAPHIDRQTLTIDNFFKSSKLKILWAPFFLSPIPLQLSVFVIKASVASYQHVILFSALCFRALSWIKQNFWCTWLLWDTGLSCTLQDAIETHNRRLDSCKDWKMVISSLEQLFEKNSGKADSRKIIGWYQNLWWLHLFQWICVSLNSPEVWLPCLQWC